MQKLRPGLRAFAKEQRRAMTRAEILLWRELRAGRFGGTKFRRQVPIGPYIVDFVCFAARLVVELDGEPHDKPEQIEHDARRDAWLESQVFKVLRFKNDIVLGNAELALKPIAEVLCGPSTDRA